MREEWGHELGDWYTVLHTLPLALEAVYIWLEIADWTLAECGLLMLCTLSWD